MLKRLWLPALAVVLAVPSVSNAQVSGDLAARIAYFSPQRAFALSVDGKAAQSRLAALDAERSKELTARTAKLNDLRDMLQRNEAVLSDLARQQRELEVQRFEVDVKRFIEDAQAEFLGVQQNLENAFFAKLRPALASVVKERGLVLLFNEDAGLLAWADPALDVTAEVAKRVDQP